MGQHKEKRENKWISRGKKTEGWEGQPKEKRKNKWISTSFLRLAYPAPCL